MAGLDPALVAAHGLAFAAAVALIACARTPTAPRALVPALVMWQLGLVAVIGTRPPSADGVFAAAFAVALMIALPGPLLLSTLDALLLVAVWLARAGAVADDPVQRHAPLLLACVALAYVTRRHTKFARRAAFLALRRLERAAVRDPLTGCASRRHFHERAAQLYEVARRYDQPLGLILLDVDSFVRVTATYGVQGADEGLRRLGAALRETIRTTDVAGRVGAEEFAIVLPQAGAAQAERLAERLRSRLHHLVVPTPRGAFDLSTSIGVAALDPAQEGDPPTLGELLARAAASLQAAKAAGRDEIAVDGQ